MSANYSKVSRNPGFALRLAVWTGFGFIAGQAIAAILVFLAQRLGFQVDETSPVLSNFAASLVAYAAALIFILKAPGRLRASGTELGFRKTLSWRDIILAVPAFIVYMFLSGALLSGLSGLIPWIETDQPQTLGFQHLANYTEFILAFVMLVVVAPLAEEIMMRGYLFGKLRTRLSFWWSALIASLTFAVLHWQWNVGIDVFALSLVLCGLREMTGSIWSGTLVHMLKNGIAFYFLFINPTVLPTIGN